MNTKIVASGYEYDPKTRDWTKSVEYVARDKMEAIRWCNMNRDWLKGLKVEEHTNFSGSSW